MIRYAAIGALSGLAWTTAALACGFHGYGPLPSMVEQLLASDHIVLARSSPENVFRFQAVEAIEGSLDHVEIPQLVDSVTRRKLDASPDTAVLFARDGTYGPWLRLLLVDSDMRPILEQISARLPDWEMGADDERFALFAGLLDHPNTAVQSLALRELDQAPYGQLRDAVTSVNIDLLLPRLDLLSEADLKPIRILLLGLSGDERTKPLLEAGLGRLARSEGALLGAYATAYAEINGPGAAATISDRFLADPDIPAGSGELIVEALALNAVNGSDAMRSAVHTEIEKALRQNPAIAPSVARQFGSRSDWSFAAALSEILAFGAAASALDAITLSQYVALAQQADSLPDTTNRAKE